MTVWIRFRLKKSTDPDSGLHSVLEFHNNLRGARHRKGIGLSYRLARLHRLAESIPGLLESLKKRLRKNSGTGRNLLKKDASSEHWQIEG